MIVWRKSSERLGQCTHDAWPLHVHSVFACTGHDLSWGGHLSGMRFLYERKVSAQQGIALHCVFALRVDASTALARRMLESFSRAPSKTAQVRTHLF